MTDEMRTHIVVGVDLTELGDHALDRALLLAGMAGGTVDLHLVHVVPPLEKRHIEEAEAALGEASMKLRARTVDRCDEVGGRAWDQMISFHVVIGEPAEAIHQVAVDVGADLIVVGTHGRKGLAKLFIGSVAQRLIENAHCSVLVARPTELEGLPRTHDEADPGRPGEKLAADHRVMQSEKIRIGKRDSHIVGLI